ncbi:unnamed protein product [Fusarium equiseti]|uniref:Rhodopsin domain-containing protein n=1 Tax=Fusarium equiseti TaxID=61235 RepID=A0A8J2J0Y1_FUSEQ|nr:unnamed protein product [Fusarium equiseti]
MAMDAPSEQEAQTTGDRLIVVLVVVVFAVMTSLLAVGLRIWCRRKMRALGWDDFAAAMTLCAYITMFFYSQALFCTKMAFVLLYYRIVSLSWWRWIYIAAIVFLVLWDICIILILFLQCIPLSSMWNPAVESNCVPYQMELGYVCSGINIFTDVAVAVLPLPFIWTLNLRRPQKIALSGVFLLGCFSISLAILRIKWTNMWSIDTWDIVRPQLWGLAEVTSALLCACIPTYKPLLVSLNAKMPRCPKKDVGSAVRHQRSDDEIGFNMDTTKVASQGQDSVSGASQRTMRAPSYGTNTYITAVQNPWGK